MSGVGVTAPTPRVGFDLWPVAWAGYVPFLEQLIDRTAARRICDVGAGARPGLPPDVVRRRKLEYVLLDISEEELAKAPDAYAKIRADVTAADLGTDEKFDLVVSRMVAEHIQHPVRFHRNVNRLLVANGRAFHFFATLYSLPFVVNRLLPRGISYDILQLLRPGPAKERPKFRAYYRWCRGPTGRQMRRFADIGYEVEEYLGFFGHNYYAKASPIQHLENLIARTLVRRPVPLLTSFAYVVLRNNLQPERRRGEDD
jgi:SAM-dependent methyltransferase